MKKQIKKALAYVLRGPLIYTIPACKIQNISLKQAEQTVANHSHDNGYTSLCNHVWTEPEYDLTIIVPVYNVEKYLKNCLDSILNQKTTYNYQVIVVNDGATDKSGEVLAQYRNNRQITIIQQKNGGAAKARNNGLKLVKGRYIMFVDADDFLPNNAVEILVGAAYELDADIVQGGYLYTDELGNISGIKQYKKCTNVGPNGTLEGLVCGKIYKADLFKNVHFPEGYWYEDTIITSIITHLSKRIVTISEFGYYYRLNPAGMTQTAKCRPKSVDTYWVHRRIMSDRQKMGMVTDCAFYEHLLRMAALCYRRTEKQPKEVKVALMILWEDLLKQERKDEFLLKPKYQRFEKVIFNGEYGRYSVLSKFCI